EAGKIMKREVVDMKSQQVTYKATFQRGIFAIKLSVDASDKISGFIIKPYFSDSLPKLERNITALNLPFRGSWLVAWGGDIPEQNYHIDNQAQKGAFDFVIVGENGKTYR